MQNQNNETSFLKPAERLSSVGEYFFSKKLQEIDQMRRQGCKIINLGIGNPDLLPYANALEALCEDAHRNDSNGYQPYRGINELRPAIAQWYKQWYHVDLDPMLEILPLNGSKEGIMHITWALTNAGDQVLVPNPGYPTYSSISALAGLDIVYYDLKEENEWHPNFEELEKMDLSKVKIMWVNYPNMPTGGHASHALFEKLVAFGRKHQIIIINDNPYSFILEDEPKSLMQVDGAKDFCLELNSLSKSHNMAGWRVGMIVGNKELIQWVATIHSNITSGQYRPIQKAAIEALKAPKSWHQANNEIYKKRQAIAFEILKTVGCSFDEHQKGLFVWGKAPQQFASDLEFSDDILYKTHVFITPGSIFGSNGQGYIRISLCATLEQLQEALERIKQNHP